MNFGLIADAPMAVQVHVIAALQALIIGPFVLFRTSRDRLHRTLGYVWVANIVIASLSSFVIFGIGLIGPFSPIHLLAVYALHGVYRGVQHARAGRIWAHRVTMRSIYFWALGVAGLLTLLPGRRFNGVLFGKAEWIGLIVIALGLAMLVYWQVFRGRQFDRVSHLARHHANAK